MTKDEALDLALEALEKSVATCFDRCAHEQVMSRPEHFINQAITAIKQARALDKKAENARELGLDYEPVAWVEYETGNHTKRPQNCGTSYCGCIECVMEPAPVQEPVAWISAVTGDLTMQDMSHTVSWAPLYTTPPAQPAQPAPVQPVAWMYDCGNGGRMYAEDLDASVGWLPLYTTPPAAQRQWVGLTDKEIDDCIKFPRRNLLARDGTTSQRIARAIEAKLKEKNT